MKRYGKEELKILLIQEKMKLNELAELISEKTGKLCKAHKLSQKIYYDSFRYNEIVDIADMLGYDVACIKRDN